MNSFQEINIKSDIFQAMLTALDAEIKRVVEVIHNEEFEGGDITLKLSLSQVEDSKEYPTKDDLGYDSFSTYWYKKPCFKHSVSTQLKKQYKLEGQHSPEAEIKFIDKEYILVPVTDPQINMLDKIEEDFLK